MELGGIRSNFTTILCSYSFSEVVAAGLTFKISKTNSVF